MVFKALMPNLYVADVERAVGFYCGVLGGTQTFKYPAEGAAEHVELRIGDVTIALSSRESVHGRELPGPGEGHPLELVVWCDSVDAAVTTLREAGAPVLVEPHDHVAGHRRAYVADPDGNWVAVVG
jgi:lactoylglutathione lyase